MGEEGLGLRCHQVNVVMCTIHAITMESYARGLFQPFAGQDGRKCLAPSLLSLSFFFNVLCHFPFSHFFVGLYFNCYASNAGISCRSYKRKPSAKCLSGIQSRCKNSRRHLTKRNRYLRQDLSILVRPPSGRMHDVDRSLEFLCKGYDRILS